MADKKITDLTELTSIDASDLIPIVDDPSGTPITKKATVENIVTAIISGGNDPVNLNGDFQVWQDGSSLTISALVSKFPDMFELTAVGAVPTGTITKQSFTVGQTDVPGEPENYYRLSITDVTSVTDLELRNYIEDVRTLAGQSATLSFYAKSDAARTPDVYINQDFGSGGSADVTSLVSALSISTSWQKFEYTISIPSISGKTVGAGNNLQILFDLDVSTQVIDLARIKLEPGSVATESPIAPFGDVLQKCKRYYQKSYNYGTAPGTASQTAGLRYFTNLISNTIVLSQLHEYIQLHEMRTIPTVTIYSYLGTSGQMSNASVVDIGSDSGAGSRIVPQGFMAVNGSTSAYTTSGNLVLYHWAADARL